MEVQVLSRKLLAPSPLNDHPPTVKLSSIDQLAPPIFVDSIFYYAPTGKDGDSKGFKNVHTERLARMEKSLADTLAVFYPLAGRYDEEGLSIECNDKGIEFLEARVKGQLDHLLQQEQPDANPLSKLIAPYVHHSPTTPLLSVQVNMFECGGFAIGLKISHLVADAYTISLFANEWAATCRTGRIGEIVRPNFDLASIFPSGDIFSECKPLVDLHPSCPRYTIVTRRFVFDGKAISRLRGDGGCQSASRVQVVTALVWRALMRVSQGRHDGRLRASLMTHAFNMRGKTGVHVPDYSCGNLWRLVVASFEPPDETKIEKLCDMVSLVREAIGNATAESEKTSSGDGVFLTSRNAWRESGEAKLYKEEVDVYDFTSWCSMRHYEVDFGWGEPCWVSSVNVPVDGLVIFLDTKDGHGIEAWVSLAQDKMLAFEQDEDIVASTTKRALENH